MEQITKKEIIAFWSKHVELKEFGKYNSIAAYCKQNNLSYSQYLYWQSKSKKQDSQEKAKFIPISLKNELVVSPGKQCEIYWPNGIHISIYSQEAFASIARIIKDNMRNVSI